eukprot:ctg_1286.g458
MGIGGRGDDRYVGYQLVSGGKGRRSGAGARVATEAVRGGGGGGAGGAAGRAVAADALPGGRAAQGAERVVAADRCGEKVRGGCFDAQGAGVGGEGGVGWVGAGGERGGTGAGCAVAHGGQFGARVGAGVGRRGAQPGGAHLGRAGAGGGASGVGALEPRGSAVDAGRGRLRARGAGGGQPRLFPHRGGRAAEPGAGAVQPAVFAGARIPAGAAAVLYDARGDGALCAAGRLRRAAVQGAVCAHRAHRRRLVADAGATAGHRRGILSVARHTVPGDEHVRAHAEQHAVRHHSGHLLSGGELSAGWRRRGARSAAAVPGRHVVPAVCDRTAQARATGAVVKRSGVCFSAHAMRGVVDDAQPLGGSQSVHGAVGLPPLPSDPSAVAATDAVARAEWTVGETDWVRVVWLTELAAGAWCGSGSAAGGAE